MPKGETIREIIAIFGQRVLFNSRLCGFKFIVFDFLIHLKSIWSGKWDLAGTTELVFLEY